MCAFGEQILRWFHEENHGLTGGQSRFDEAEPAEKLPPNVHLFGVNQYKMEAAFYGLHDVLSVPAAAARGRSAVLNAAHDFKALAEPLVMHDLALAEERQRLQ